MKKPRTLQQITNDLRKFIDEGEYNRLSYGKRLQDVFNKLHRLTRTIEQKSESLLALRMGLHDETAEQARAALVIADDEREQHNERVRRELAGKV